MEITPVSALYLEVDFLYIMTVVIPASFEILFSWCILFNLLPFNLLESYHFGVSLANHI